MKPAAHWLLSTMRSKTYDIIGQCLQRVVKNTTRCSQGDYVPGVHNA